MTNAEARFTKSLRPRKPEGSLGRTAQDVHLDSHTARELCLKLFVRLAYNAERDTPKRFSRGPKSQEGVVVGVGEELYLKLHCHHNNSYALR